jgi:hypothetical protein
LPSRIARWCSTIDASSRNSAESDPQETFILKSSQHSIVVGDRTVDLARELLFGDRGGGATKTWWRWCHHCYAIHRQADDHRVRSRRAALVGLLF